MRNGPIYKQMEPEGGHRVKRGLHQGQRPGPRRQGLCREELTPEEGRGGVRYSVPLRVLGHGPFLSKNVQPASKSYLVLGKRQAPRGWA